MKTALLTNAANKRKCKNDNSSDANIIEKIFPDELTVNDSYEQGNLKQLLIKKKEKDQPFKPKTHKDYYNTKGKNVLI